MIEWRIYYEGGVTFDNEQGAPLDAPAIGVLSILQKLHCSHHPQEWLRPARFADCHHSETLENADWYWWRPDAGQWFRGTLLGFLDQAMHCGAVSLKQGRYAGHHEWERAMLAIGADTDFRG